MKHIVRFCAILMPFSLLVSMLSAQDAAGFFLLTENGAHKPGPVGTNAPVLKTGGTYYATPAFDQDIAEKGTITAQIPFPESILCDGKAEAGVVWSGKQMGTLNFDLKKNYYISRVRVNVPFIPGAQGVEKIGVYTWDEMLEAGSRPMKEMEPQNGWNEFVINKGSDKIKLDFTPAKGCGRMAVSEVEIWGREAVQEADAPKNGKTTAAAGIARNYIAFDFGPTNAPVYDDFTPVDEKTVYTKQKGYGWIPFKGGQPCLESNYGAGSVSVPGLLQRDRGKEVKISDSLFRDFCGAERAYHTQVEQEFVVDVKNGKYLVCLFMGDLVYGSIGPSKITVDAEGKRVVNSVAFGNDLCARSEFETEVTDGQLNLRFGSDEEESKKGWKINGAVVFPVNNAEEKTAAEAAIRGMEDNIRSCRDKTMHAVFTKVERPPDKAFPLAKTDEDRGYVLFVRDWMEMIYPDTIPLKSEAERTEIVFSCAPGEYEPAAFGIYPLTNFEAEIETSDLAGASRADKIAGENLAVNVIGYMPERIKPEKKTAGNYSYYCADSSWGASYMEKVPKILQPYKDKVEINETKQIWLTLHVPEDAKPGSYAGTLTFRPRSRDPQVLKIKLNVYPIKLAKSDRVEGMYWGETMQIYPQNRQKEILDMARHGIRAVVIGKTLPGFKEQNGKLELDFTKLDKLVEDLKNAGLTGYMPFELSTIKTGLTYFLRDNPAVAMKFDEAYKYVVAEIYKRSRENRWPETLFYPVDEIGNSVKRMDELKQLGALIYAAAKGTKIYCTANNYDSGIKCADYIDYWCSNIQISKEQEREILKRGKVYMRYGCSFNYNPRISRIVSGFGFWCIPAVAMYYWHYQCFNGDPYNPLDGSARDWCSSYPSPEGPVNSVDFEAIREGIDDLNYIHTVQTLVAEAKKRGLADEATVKEGEKILGEIENCDPSHQQYDFDGVPNEKVHEWRARLAQVIINLQNGVGQQH